LKYGCNVGIERFEKLRCNTGFQPVTASSEFEVTAVGSFKSRHHGLEARGTMKFLEARN
jgi:hypothetical protein